MFTQSAERSNQFCFRSEKLAFQSHQLIGVDGLSGAVERDDDRKTDRNFRCGNGDDEEYQHLAVIVWEAIDRVETGEGDQGEVCRAEHQFKAHEHDDDVAAEHHTGKADGEEQSGDEKVIV